MSKLDDSHIRPSVMNGDRVASEESVSGIVHVIREASEVIRFREGEILVASEVPEDWSHLFVLAKAIITETCDLPEYVSAAANELSLPVITGVQGVTNDLRSGDIVTMHIDGMIQRLQDSREPDSRMRVSVPAAVHARQYANEAVGSEGVNSGAEVIKFKIADRVEAVKDQSHDDRPRNCVK